MIINYPDSEELDLSMRKELHTLFKNLEEGVSEFTFANIYLFRNKNSYRISNLGQNKYLITGTRKGESFFLLPFGLPDSRLLDKLFKEYSTLKLVTEKQASLLSELGYTVIADRDNFDYLYLRENLAKLNGRKYHKKRNLINSFINNYSYSGRPLKGKYIKDALMILEKWQEQRDDLSDYIGAKEALDKIEELGLCGSIVYVDGNPGAYTLGEKIQRGNCFTIHFEKALVDYKGLYQFINMCFASLLPKKFKIINREQDMGDEGLRQAKMSYRPYSFVKKYKVTVK